MGAQVKSRKVQKSAFLRYKPLPFPSIMLKKRRSAKLQKSAKKVVR
jgi:hypothetical protein